MSLSTPNLAMRDVSSHRSNDIKLSTGRYFNSCWYVAEWAEDLKPGALAARTIAGEPIVIWRTESGGLNALADRCCHRLAPLSCGRIEGNAVRCGYHGAVFEGSGRCTEFPGVERVSEKFRVSAYPVVERHRWIWVWIGDPDLADPSLIPLAHYHDRSDMVISKGHMTHAANHLLVSDNLLDFSHLAYVHSNSFGAGEDWGKVRATVTELPRGVRVERWLIDQPPWPFLPDSGRIDVHNTYDYLWPGILVLAGKNFPTGSAAAHDYKLPPEYLMLSMGATCQAVTPIDSENTEYRFSSITPERDATKEVVENRHRATLKAFDEDKHMLEAQHHMIRLSPEISMMPMAHDRASTIFRHQLERQQT
ncbi:Rieske 2Fe-2S domain-containing protein [Variovorax sp. GB1P17]|uniref:Rieske 2Fe-2S domain-containing protein n=1 Tax=Variovorax sp. GB1P17 TaxID=3443740 RepID=UPI003F455006